MKKQIGFLIMMFVFTASFFSEAQAQTKNYFAGKWELLISGTPYGDVKMTLDLAHKGGKLNGTLTSEDNKPIEITKLEEVNKVVTVYFNADGYDVSFNIKEKDKENVTGSMMDMFDVSGKRL